MYVRARESASVCACVNDRAYNSRYCFFTSCEQASLVRVHTHPPTHTYTLDPPSGLVPHVENNHLVWEPPEGPTNAEVRLSAPRVPRVCARVVVVCHVSSSAKQRARA